VDANPESYARDLRGAISLIYLLEIELTVDHALAEEERKRIRSLLPFWAMELLAIHDEAKADPKYPKATGIE
jgi:hypothetical protein